MTICTCGHPPESHCADFDSGELLCCHAICPCAMCYGKECKCQRYYEGSESA